MKNRLLGVIALFRFPARMSDILFIKTSSLGDVIHHMPAVSDARRNRPQARIGWVVEEAFAPLVRLQSRGGHRHSGRVAPVAGGAAQRRDLERDWRIPPRDAGAAA